MCCVIAAAMLALLKVLCKVRGLAPCSSACITQVSCKTGSVCSRREGPLHALCW